MKSEVESWFYFVAIGSLNILFQPQFLPLYTGTMDLCEV